MGERQTQNRLDFLFEKLNEGHTAEEIDQLLEKRAEPGKKAQIVGAQREDKAASLLDSLDLVSNATNLEKHSKDDVEGKDIRIRLDINELKDALGYTPAIRHVWVQVKSKNSDIDKFRARYGRAEDEIDRNLAEQRLIVVNITRPKEQVVASFMKQLIYISEYWGR